MFKKFGKKSAAAVGVASAVSLNASAAGAAWDYSTLTSSIDMSTISIGILAGRSQGASATVS
jgi:hypothetical protein